ncbi:MAG: hypothetical protein JRJ69_13100 [Deltaproteobacteria bacterium]|nr:hypothetical protein [Deltaproteobacteria bacterium]MBW1738454.1 hypothetical protein [Deltaproteobacteria bacterium]MBW1910757.1 hypothetical protein [Deltaproteobacteria bacterium]MBW2035097.1 hypothetical protein [Deltaproteobacteria bacterium]MBW2115534.1 hypothetical protein [Deltaproteobacteria bacterium]
MKVKPASRLMTAEKAVVSNIYLIVLLMDDLDIPRFWFENRLIFILLPARITPKNIYLSN